MKGFRFDVNAVTLKYFDDYTEVDLKNLLKKIFGHPDGEDDDEYGDIKWLLNLILAAKVSGNGSWELKDDEKMKEAFPLLDALKEEPKLSAREYLK